MFTEASVVTAPSPAQTERPSITSGAALLPLAIASTFTAEPIESPLRFLLGELGFDPAIRFADYNQVLQQLLDPTSLFGRNSGVNLALVRFEDWAKFRAGGNDDEAVRRGAAELSDALTSYAARTSTPTLVCIGPPSPAVMADRSRPALFTEVEGRLRAELSGLGSIHFLGPEALEPYPVQASYDGRRDRIGHIPYTPEGFSALALAVARRIHALRSPGYKVIALDCDHTLWKGVVGEDGPEGISFPPGKRFLQEFVIGQQAAGMLVCLVSKNAERDVLAVFETRPDMTLRREHLVSWRVNWEPKSRNLVALAEELNLGLDSFIFLDDNPVECAEVRAALPGVLTLEIPADEEIESFLGHIWAFDRLKVTAEDRQRTEQYRTNSERTRFERESGGIEAFLAGLELRVEITPPAPDELDRVAQLTQRTNQFNFTTVRRNEAEVQALGRSGLECLAVRAADRFGDYGLVGVMIFGTVDSALAIDTMLMSCRSMGRGVEHAMLRHLGRLAAERGKAEVLARFVPTAKNLPAANFLESVGSHYRVDEAAEVRYRIPAEVAATVEYSPGKDLPAQPEMPTPNGLTPVAPTRGKDKSKAYQRLASELRRVDALQRAIETLERSRRPIRETPLAEPRTERERQVVAVWKRVLNLDEVGIHDLFAQLGGTSLKAASLFAAIEEQFGTRLPLTTILEAPTVAALADRIERALAGGGRESVKVLKPGGAGPALFLIHDGDGETLLYGNLAQRVRDDVAVYGLEPFGTDRCPILHTRIPDMAAHYVRLIREAQPEGPYFLGGMCAGGTIAFETALQLTAQGQAIGFVALLDSADPEAAPRPGREMTRRWTSLSRSIQAESNRPAAVRLLRRALTVGKKIRNVMVYETTSRLKRRSEARRFRRFRALTDRGRPVPRRLENLAVRTVFVEAEKEYRPAAILGCPVILFRATDGQGGDEPFVFRYSDPLLGWGPRVNSGPELVEVPGGHSSMLQEPHVERIADHLNLLIARQAQARGTS